MARSRPDDDEPSGWESYKSSPIRFAILGVLVVALLVMAYFLYEKQQREKNATAHVPQWVVG